MSWTGLAEMPRCQDTADLFLRYFELGGMSSASELEAFCYGFLEPSAHDHDLLAHALNERFSELGETIPSHTRPSQGAVTHERPGRHVRQAGLHPVPLVLERRAVVASSSARGNP